MPKTKRRSPNTEDKEIGFRVRKRRQDMKFSLEHVATGISVSKQQLRKYELGRNKISARRLKQIANILGTTTDELIGSVEAASLHSDMDREIERLWKGIDNIEHKHTILSVMRIVADKNAEDEPEVHKLDAIEKP